MGLSVFLTICGATVSSRKWYGEPEITYFVLSLSFKGNRNVLGKGNKCASPSGCHEFQTHLAGRDVTEPQLEILKGGSEASGQCWKELFEASLLLFLKFRAERSRPGGCPESRGYGDLGPSRADVLGPNVGPTDTSWLGGNRKGGTREKNPQNASRRASRAIFLYRDFIEVMSPFLRGQVVPSEEQLAPHNPRHAADGEPKEGFLFRAREGAGERLRSVRNHI